MRVPYYEGMLVVGGVAVGLLLAGVFMPKPTRRRGVPTIVQLHQLQKACILDNAEWAQFVFPDNLILYSPIDRTVQAHLQRKFAP